MSFFERPIDHINLTVPDLKKAIEFYTEIMGFKEVERYKGGNKEFVFLSDGTILYELLEESSELEGSLNHVAYTSSDIHKDYDFFKENGFKLLGPVGFLSFLFENGIYYFFVEGATGELIEFCQRK